MANNNELFQKIFYPILSILIVFFLIVLLYHYRLYYFNKKRFERIVKACNSECSEFILSYSNVCKAVIQDHKIIHFISSTSIQTDSPLCLHKTIYFEIDIIKSNKDSNIYFGLAMNDPLSIDIPGYTENSISINCKTGQVYSNKKIIATLFHSQLKDNITLGLFYNHHQSQIYFTLNGIPCNPILFTIDSSVKIFPTIYADNHVSIAFNFGISPFKFRWANSCCLGIVKRDWEPRIPPTYITSIETV